MQVKVFTTGNSANAAGETLTNMIEEWRKSFERGIDIIAIHSNSNKFGWMVVITYKCN